ncbi:uncharacterized protein BDCG_17475 [Blastomyces dermatitidis ER-3]|uniref:Uncharacterized protein n=1 Tax=Ajellomyces dermatitidis (strain ER-3 / ATCC MYA-2586) TaxID=559297 RepID=A0ABX2VYQ4_AJEDR|nr:uncharacterized protein BDCG_17475 [Blastomyces dermatitidis ER-3]OAT02273.1 hypothetical protein BDCG_17475 [Blastomyces dermatitidis ER-3]
MKISMLKKTLTFELLQALVSTDEDQTYEGFCTQLRTMDDHLTKLKNIQNSGRRHYTSATYTPALTNNSATYTPAVTDNPATYTPTPKNNHDADAMDWIDSKAYAQARVSAIQTGFRVPGITPEEVAN